MKKVILITITILIILTGCSQKEVTKVYLSDTYYQNNAFIPLTSIDLSNLRDDTYLLYTYNNYCTLDIPCESIFESFMTEYNISIISIPFEEYKKTTFYKKVKYAPTIILVNKGKIIAYLDANNDDDLAKYQDITAFTNWISSYIYLSNTK